MKQINIFFIGLVCIFIFSAFLPGVFLSTDILHTFQLYHSGFSKVHNSLLADPVFQFEPWRYFAKKQLSHFNFPIWNNLNGISTPFFANPQTAVLFPLNIIYYVLPSYYAINVIILLKLYLFGSFCFLYFNTIQKSERLSLLASIVLSVSGFFVVWVQWPHTNVYLFFPLLLFITEKLILSWQRRYLYLLSIVYLFAILGGHPETLFHITIIHILYILFRFWDEKKKIIEQFIFITVGFLLSSIQLVPFLEYLLNSFVLQHRMNQTTEFLPATSLIMYFFPFISGAPHISFYKPVFSNINFQELIGGYAGPFFLIAAIASFFTRKKPIILFWTYIILGCLLLSYTPIGSWIPFFSLAANNRLISFISFGLITISILHFEELANLKIKNWVNGRNTTAIILLGTLFLLLINGALYYAKANFTNNLIHIISHLSIHIYLQIVSSIIAFYIIFNKKINNSKVWFSLLTLMIFFQTIFLFTTYNPLIPKNEYYPENTITKALAYKSLSVLEVGNPNIVPNINLVYSINSIENDDAIGVKNFKQNFDTLFPQKNFWNRVEEVDKNNLKASGVGYLISDYDINAISQKVQENYSHLLGPVTAHTHLTIDFIPQHEKLTEIRLLSANYNRPNNCTVSVSITDKKSLKNILQKNINCNNFLDKMFYTIDLENTYLLPNSLYEINITSNGSKENAVGFWGNEINQPYIQLFYSSSEKNEYKLIATENNVKLWEVPHSQMKQSINQTVPKSFIIGMLISSFTAFLFGISFLQYFRKKYSFSFNLSKKSVLYQIKIVLGAFLLGIACVVVVITYVLPKTLPLPPTTAINWFTVHNHSLTLDYIKFGLIIVLIPTIIIVSWIYIVWKQNQK